MSEARVLRDLLEDVLATNTDFPAMFYERLFVAHPTLKPLFFRSSPDAQQKMFAQKLMLLIDVIDQPDTLKTELRKVKASHVAYGVTREMYDWVGEALVAAVSDVLGARLTPGQKDALGSGWATMTAIIFDER